MEENGHKSHRMAKAGRKADKKKPKNAQKGNNPKVSSFLNNLSVISCRLLLLHLVARQPSRFSEPRR